MKKITKLLSIFLLVLTLVLSLSVGGKLLADIDPPVGSPSQITTVATIDPPVGTPTTNTTGQVIDPPVG